MRGLENVTREATQAATDGARVAEESNALSETGSSGLQKILTGIQETTALEPMGEITRGSEEQLLASREVTEAITVTATQSRQVATASAQEQAKGANSIVQATGQMRKVTKEVAQAMGEHGRAARRGRSRRPNPPVPSRTRCARRPPSRARGPRRSSAPWTRCAKAAFPPRGPSPSNPPPPTRLPSVRQFSWTKLTSEISRALAEQASGASQVTASADNLRVQSLQTARGMQEQARAMKDVSAASQNVTKQIKLITAANLEHSGSASAMLARLEEVRAVTRQSTADAMTLGKAGNENRRAARNPSPKRK